MGKEEPARDGLNPQIYYTGSPVGEGLKGRKPRQTSNRSRTVEKSGQDVSKDEGGSK